MTRYLSTTVRKVRQRMKTVESKRWETKIAHSRFLSTHHTNFQPSNIEPQTCLHYRLSFLSSSHQHIFAISAARFTIIADLFRRITMVHLGLFAACAALFGAANGLNILITVGRSKHARPLIIVLTQSRMTMASAQPTFARRTES